MIIKSGQRPAVLDDYVIEGQFFAYPLCVQEECRPIAPDCSYLSAVSASEDGKIVWGATGGDACHVFAACFKGAAGGIVDLGTVPEARAVPDIAAIPRGHELSGSAYSALFTVWTGTSSRICRQAFGYPRDVIQEPSFAHGSPEIMAEIPGEKVTQLMVFPKGVQAMTGNGVFLLASDSAQLASPEQIFGSKPQSNSVSVLGEASYWLAGGGILMRDRLGSGDACEVLCVKETDISARLGVIDAGVLVAVWNDGTATCIELSTGAVRELPLLPLEDIQCVAILPDGRVYGVCGDGIGHFFRLDVRAETCEALGAVATAAGVHRYGFTFSSASVTHDGTIFFGESDRGGHLWAYYPPVMPARGS